MANYLKRGFRAQLTSAMDSILRTALCEITKIFESSLHDHQLELAQKGEEICRLQIKLEKAESKLKETEGGGGGGDSGGGVAEKDETQREPEDVLNPSGQTADVPEIVVEVPDDWCAPLGCDNMAAQPSRSRQEDIKCPNVTLRPLSISLWHIPAIKQEVQSEGEEEESRQITTLDNSPGKSSSPDKSLKSGLEHTGDQSLPLPTPKRGRGRPPGSKRALQPIKQEPEPDPPVTTVGSQSGKDIGTDKGKVLIKSQAKRRKKSATKSESEGQEAAVNNSEPQRYSCKFCHKVFDTQFGRSVHIRSHKKCPGCRKIFPFPSALCNHKKSCPKLKKRDVGKNAKSLATPEQKPESQDEEKTSSPSKTQIFVNKKSTPTSDKHSPGSLPKHTAAASKTTKKYKCRDCDKKFYSRFSLRDHIRIHTGELPFACTVCPQKFRVKHSLKSHMFKVHKEQKYGEANGDLAWTRPLDEAEDNLVDASGCSKDPSPAVTREDVPFVKRKKQKCIDWQTVGRQSAEGFICSVCERVLSSKYLLIEHFRIHTGEKPITCEKCGATFRCRSQMSAHRNKCRGSSLIMCQKCGKKFPTQMKYNRHVVEAHKDWPNACQLCGKGFFTAGRLRNHYERVHV